MRHALFCTIMALVPTGLTTNTESVSLSKFVPRIENLPEACQAAYNASIDGCSRTDFPQERNPDVNNCSADCVNGLIKIVQLVNQQCSTVRVPADSIIGVALLGNLLPNLCGKIVVVTEQPSSTQASLPSSSTSAPASTTQQQVQPSSAQQQPPSSQSTAPPPSAANPAAPSQSTLNAATSTSQGLMLDTGTPPPVPSQTAIGQKSNPDSGGGSPFDVALSGPSSSSSRVWNKGIPLAAVCGFVTLYVLNL